MVRTDLDTSIYKHKKQQPEIHQAQKQPCNNLDSLMHDAYLNIIWTRN